jgi:hypothetical protein
VAIALLQVEAVVIAHGLRQAGAEMGDRALAVVCLGVDVWGDHLN